MSEFVEVKTAELAGNALRWAVGMADGLDVRSTGHAVWVNGKVPHADKRDDYYDPLCWGQGGPLLDKFDVWLSDDECEHVASTPPHINEYIKSGNTKLVAACRAIVYANLGEVVLVPKELIND